MRVVINVEEAKTIAKARRDNKVKNDKGAPRAYKDEYRQDVAGAAAELAFEKLTGLKMNRDITFSGDGNIDFTFTLPDGKTYTVDVKASDSPKSTRLFLTKNKAHKAADILVSAKVSGDMVVFMGWDHRDQLVTKGEIIMGFDDYGEQVEKYTKRHEKLLPMKRLMDALATAIG